MSLIMTTSNQDTSPSEVNSKKPLLILNVICKHQCPNDSHTVSILLCPINLHREENSNTALKRFWRDFSELVPKCGSHRSSQHWLTGLFFLLSATTFLSFFVRSRHFDFVLCYVFNFDSIEVRMVVETRVLRCCLKMLLIFFVKWKVVAVVICFVFGGKMKRPRASPGFWGKYYPLHTAEYATVFLLSDWLYGMG